MWDYSNLFWKYFDISACWLIDSLNWDYSHVLSSYEKFSTLGFFLKVLYPINIRLKLVELRFSCILFIWEKNIYIRCKREKT